MMSLMALGNEKELSHNRKLWAGPLEQVYLVDSARFTFSHLYIKGYTDKNDEFRRGVNHFLEISISGNLYKKWEISYA